MPGNIHVATSDRSAVGKELSLAEALAEIEQLRAQLAAEREAKVRLAEDLVHEIAPPMECVGDSVQFLRDALDDLSKLFHGYRDALMSLRATRTSAAAQLADLRELEIECDFEFLSVEVPKALDRTLKGAERVSDIVRVLAPATDAGKRRAAAVGSDNQTQAKP